MEHRSESEQVLGSESKEVLGPLASDLAVAALALARRFAGGATLWCWAPEAPEHASHVAVEFVHPVIVGKPALPAVAVTGPESAETLRQLARSGDALVVVAPGSAAGAVVPVLRHAPSWGVTTLWIGSGDRPPAGTADHVLWMGSDAPTAAFDGTYVLAYHLLWELTHVCFEHPGLLQPEAPCEGDRCVTCSDEGRLAEVITADDSTATVRTAAGVEEIDTSLVGAVSPGELVLVHAGSALVIVDRPA